MQVWDFYGLTDMIQASDDEVVGTLETTPLTVEIFSPDYGIRVLGQNTLDAARGEWECDYYGEYKTVLFTFRIGTNKGDDPMFPKEVYPYYARFRGMNLVKIYTVETFFKKVNETVKYILES